MNIIFSIFLFTYMLETSIFSFVCGWYGDATLCMNPYCLKALANCQLRKWDPYSLTRTYVISKRENIFLFKNLSIVFLSILGMQWAPPTLIRNQMPLEYNHLGMMMEWANKVNNPTVKNFYFYHILEMRLIAFEIPRDLSQISHFCIYA